MPSNRRQDRRIVWDRAFAMSLTLTLVGLLMPFEVTPVAAAVGTLAVDTTVDDPAATACTDAPDDCSLRGALLNANADGNAEIETVTVPAGTFVLTVAGGDGLSGSLNVHASVIVQGAGSGQTIIDGNYLDRVILVYDYYGPVTDTVLDLSGVTLMNGRPCAEPGGDDGNNASGGGLMVHGVAHLTDVVIRDNETCGSGGGAWVTQYGSSLSLTRSVVAGNQSSYDGGGIHSDGALEVIDSTIRDNQVTTAGIGGGGLFLRAVTTISGSTIVGNTGRGSAGGIGAHGATITIVNSTISGNRATYYNSGTPQYFPGSGGGIFAYRSALTLRHVTVTANIADWNYYHQFNGSGGGILANESGTVVLENSIVAGNIAGNDCAFLSGGVSSTGSFGCSTSVIDDPALGVLADNGGRTLTHAPLDGSPALDAGESSVCEAVDQRGESRPSGAACDAGSYELQVIVEPPPTPVPSPDPTTAPSPEPTTTPSAPPTPGPDPTSPPPSLPPGSITISVDHATVDEPNAGTTTGQVTVRLSGASETSVFVDVATSDGTATAPGDYLATTTSLAFAPGETAKTVDVTVAGDRVRELGETFRVTLSNPFGGTIQDGTATVTIQEAAFGAFNPSVVSTDLVNAYLLAYLSHYAYEGNAAGGGAASSDFATAFRERFDRPSEGVAVTGFLDDFVTQTQGAFVETDDALIIVIRGTEEPGMTFDTMDLIIDGGATQAAGIHDGFAAAATSVFPATATRALAARSAGKRVWLTGHSLGGAVAEVLGLQLQTLGIEVQGIYTFGAPRPFSQTVALAYNVLFAARPTVRWVNNLDPVPHVPPGVPFMNYVHVGTLNNIIPGTQTCTIQIGGAERFNGADLDDHQTSRYLARIYENLPSDAMRNAMPDPPAEPFTQRAGCTTPPMSAADYARAAFLAGRDVFQTARRLAFDYALSGDATAAVLAAAGWTWTQVSGVLKSLWGWTADQVIQLLTRLQVRLDTIVAAVRDTYLLSSRKIAQKLENAGYLALDVARSIKSVLALGIDQVADALAYAAYSAGDTMVALRAVFLAGEQPIADAMKRAGFPAPGVAAALVSVFGAGAQGVANILYFAGYAASDTGGALKTVFGFGADLVAATLRGANYFVSDIAAHLKSGFGLKAAEAVRVLERAGFRLTAIMTALRDVFSTTAQTATDLLRTLGFDATDVLTALSVVFSTTAQTGGEILVAAGFTATQVMTALKAVYSTSAQGAANILRAAGVSASRVMTALQGVFSSTAQGAAGICASASYGATEVATGLKSVYSRTAAQTTTILRGAGFSATAVATALKSVFTQTASQVTALLKAAGYGVGAIAAALKSVFSRTAGQAIDLLRAAGYSVTSVATALKEAYGRSASQVISLLRTAGYGVNDVATALKDAFALSAAQNAQLLWWANYTFEQILGALLSVFDMTLSAALQLLASLGIG